MSDFLSRLVERAMGKMPVVQPRLLSRYEAGPGVPGVRGQALEEPPGPDVTPAPTRPEQPALGERTLESPPAVRVAAPTPDAPRPERPSAKAESKQAAPSRPDVRPHQPPELKPPTDARRASPTDAPRLPGVEARSRLPASKPPTGRVPPRDETGARPTRRVRGDTGPLAEPSVRPAMSAVRSPTQRGPGEGPPPRRPSETSPAQAVRDSDDDADSPTQRGPGEGPPPRRPSETSPAQAVRDSDDDADRSLHPAVTAVLEDRAEQPPPIDGDFRHPANRLASPGVETRTHATSPAAGEPTIKVTIGRIEVRAVTPPAQPAKPKKPTAPRLSLDDYLRRRDEERR